MDLLRYYFRHSDKKDLREILSDCEACFHQGARKGMSEDEICAQLGSPKNIYRYYMGKPVIPADNPVIERQYAGGYDRVPRYNRDKARAYDWKREPEQRQRQAESRRHYRDYEEIREEPIYEDTYDYDERYSYEDDFFDKKRKHRRKRPVQRSTGALERSFYTFLGGIFSFLGKLFFLLFLIAFVGSGFDGIRTAHRRIDGSEPLLTIQNKLLRSSIRCQRSLNHTMLEANIRIVVFEEHGSTYWEILRNAGNKPTNATVIPYPAALEIRQLNVSLVDVLHQIQNRSIVCSHAVHLLSFIAIAVHITTAVIYLYIADHITRLLGVGLFYGFIISYIALH